MVSHPETGSDSLIRSDLNRGVTSFMVIFQSSELGWEVTMELPADSLSIGRGSVNPQPPPIW